MSIEQHIGTLMNLSSFLGAPIGDKEAEAKNIFGGIVDRYKSLKANKDLGPRSEKLGRGKRLRYSLLEGCRKGQTVKGLHEIKNYLKKFGYTTMVANINDYHEDDDKFDDVLESEIKVYQLNYNLDVTRKLDTRTLEQMMLSRSGVPDNDNNGRSSMRWNLIMEDAWTLSSVCARAFATWAAVSHFQFREVGEGEYADILIGFRRGAHGDGHPFDGAGGKIVAHAFHPTDGRLHYDADENWGTDPASDEIDLELVTLHEIGHILGLGHTSDEEALPLEAVMFPTIGHGVTKRQLGSDDINGVQTLYA
ncbi:metalloendoproteinase 1-like [Papaver somniferum]|uniref:metalloendoproteinase 1-like n=1 Tax=Papaver somniferum TaxID=3469 RepID=UPI000E6F736D|nr:metalloendoproteinase 1-like [Papaver somniferum]